MKKLLTIVLAAALLVSLFAVTSHAEDTNLALGRNVETAISEGNANLALGFWDKNYLTDGLVPVFGEGQPNQDRLGWYAGSPTQDTYITVSIDLGVEATISKVVLLGQKFLDGNNVPNTFDVNLSTDAQNWSKTGGEVEREGPCDSLTYETSMDARYLLITITKMPNVADATNYYCGFGEIEVYGSAKGDAVPETTYSGKNIGDGAAIGVWLQGDNHAATLEFTTAGAFKGFGVPIYWASNANVPNGPFAKYKIELFKFAYNPEYTLSQAPVKSYELNGQGDDNPKFAFDFDEALEAGTYIARFTITNFDEILTGKMNGQGDDVDMTPYLVLPKMDANPDPAKFAFSTADAFNFYVVGEDGIETFYLANPDNTDAPSQPATGENPPETQPQTGDAAVAMIAVLAVLTMGAAVVFAKKRSF